MVVAVVLCVMWLCLGCVECVWRMHVCVGSCVRARAHCTGGQHPWRRAPPDRALARNLPAPLMPMQEFGFAADANHEDYSMLVFLQLCITD